MFTKSISGWTTLPPPKARAAALPIFKAIDLVFRRRQLTATIAKTIEPDLATYCFVL